MWTTPSANKSIFFLVRGIELKIAGVQIYDADISDYLNYKSSIFQNTDGLRIFMYEVNFWIL
mgnify:CR=1 FL=1